jgi:hypothetical protein
MNNVVEWAIAMLVKIAGLCMFCIMLCIAGIMAVIDIQLFLYMISNAIGLANLIFLGCAVFCLFCFAIALVCSSVYLLTEVIYNG